MKKSLTIRKGLVRAFPNMKSLGILILGGLVGCSVHIEHKGCYVQSFDLASIKEGKDTKETVKEKWGEPSTTSVFGQERWYYMHREIVSSSVSGKKPLLHRSLIITFNDQGRVIKKEEVTGENKIPLCKDHTKEKGYKTSFLKETFRNIGKFSQSGGVGK